MGCIALVRYVLVLRCGLAGVVWYPDTTPPQPNHNVTSTHIEPEQYNPWNDSTNVSQAPEDGCINIGNMLSIKSWNNKVSDIKLVSLYSIITSLEANTQLFQSLSTSLRWCIDGENVALRGILILSQDVDE